MDLLQSVYSPPDLVPLFLVGSFYVYTALDLPELVVNSFVVCDKRDRSICDRQHSCHRVRLRPGCCLPVPCFLLFPGTAPKPFLPSSGPQYMLQPARASCLAPRLPPSVATSPPPATVSGPPQAVCSNICRLLAGCTQPSGTFPFYLRQSGMPAAFGPRSVWGQSWM